MSDNLQPRMGGQHEGATIPSATPVVVQMIGAPIPCTVTLKSGAAGRLIEASTDGGTEFFTAAPDHTSATQLAVAFLAPVSHIRLTGTTNDSWSIR